MKLLSFADIVKHLLAEKKVKVVSFMKYSNSSNFFLTYFKKATRIYHLIALIRKFLIPGKILAGSKKLMRNERYDSTF